MIDVSHLHGEERHAARFEAAQEAVSAGPGREFGEVYERTAAYLKLKAELHRAEQALSELRERFAVAHNRHVIDVPHAQSMTADGSVAVLPIDCGDTVTDPDTLDMLADQFAQLAQLAEACATD